MLQLGKVNRLQVIKQTPFGYYLGTEQHNVLLPNSEVSSELAVGDWQDVLVYNDSEDELVASKKTPKAFAGDCACLKVVGTSSAGAFVDWGMEKDLLVPFGQQDKPMEEGKSYVVYIYTDHHTQRLVASSKLRNFLHETSQGFVEKQAVSALICGQTQMGYKVVVNNHTLALLHKNDTFGTIRIGQKMDAFIKHIREDGKLDLCLQFTDGEAKGSLAEQILADLKANGGVSSIPTKAHQS